MNQTKKKNPLKRLLSMRGMGQVVTVTIGLIVLLVAFALINPNFWSPTNCFLNGCFVTLSETPYVIPSTAVSC